MNEIITHKFDFNNEEVIAYYISFLKTLSFKLNTYTIHFFFNEVSGFIIKNVENVFTYFLDH